MTTPNPWVRPYVLTSGRTQTRYPLQLETLISVPHSDPHALTGMAPESRALYEHARRGMNSLAELSAYSGVPLGVAWVLIRDLAALKMVSTTATAPT